LRSAGQLKNVQPETAADVRYTSSKYVLQFFCVRSAGYVADSSTTMGINSSPLLTQNGWLLLFVVHQMNLVSLAIS